MEAIRCKRAALSHGKDEKVLFYYPNYVKNPYQQNLYSASKSFKYDVHSVNHLEINTHLAEATFSRRIVFHQHWLKDLYWKTESLESGAVAIDRHIGILRALKSYGVKICWTLHNLVDHDSSPQQEKLNNYVLRQMAEVSDLIFIHTQGAGELLSSYCGRDLDEKIKLLEHPLYDDLLALPRAHLPEEIKQQDFGVCRIVLCVGMIRPYKGVPDLIRAFQKVARENKNHGLHLIIAGQLQDPEVLEKLNGLEGSIRRCVSLIARRVQDEEMAALMRLADVSVTSYRKILTSGSYYLATTFAKPTIAPRKGMFTEIVKDDETGFLYDGSVDELAKLLAQISQLPISEIERVGNNAQQACNHLTISEVSARFFSFLEAEE